MIGEMSSLLQPINVIVSKVSVNIFFILLFSLEPNPAKKISSGSVESFAASFSRSNNFHPPSSEVLIEDCEKTNKITIATEFLSGNSERVKYFRMGHSLKR